jgi:hypothetical protein
MKMRMREGRERKGREGEGREGEEGGGEGSHQALIIWKMC